MQRRHLLFPLSFSLARRFFSYVPPLFLYFLPVQGDQQEGQSGLYAAPLRSTNVEPRSCHRATSCELLFVNHHQDVVKMFKNVVFFIWRCFQLGANIGVRNSFGETALSRILPETLEQFLDSCTTHQNHPLHKDFKVGQWSSSPKTIHQ